MTATKRPVRRIPGEEGSALGRVITRADLRGAVNSACLTAGVLGALPVLYGLGVLLGHITFHFGWVLYLAANGAS